MSENDTQSSVENTAIAVPSGGVKRINSPMAEVSEDGTFSYEFALGPPCGDESPVGVDWMVSYLMVLTDELLLQANRHGPLHNARLKVDECYLYNDGIKRLWVRVRLTARESLDEPRSQNCHRPQERP